MDERTPQEKADFPLTPAEHVLAFQNPYSLDYKEREKQLIAAIVEESICLQLIDYRMKLTEEEVKADEARLEEEELEYTREQAHQTELQQQAQQEQQAVKGQSQEILLALKATLMNDITKLNETRQIWTNHVTHQNRQLSQLQGDWNLHQAASAIKYTVALEDKLQKNHVQIMSLENKPIALNNDITQKIQQAILDVKSPTEILKINPMMQDAGKMMMINDLVCEFNTHKKIHDLDGGNFDPALMLRALKNNSKFPIFRHGDEARKNAEAAISAHLKKTKAEVECLRLDGQLQIKSQQLEYIKDELIALEKRPRLQPGSPNKTE
jgi:hypothetical protein